MYNIREIGFGYQVNTINGISQFFCIDKYGKIILARSLTVITFIIKMEINLTTTLPILNVFQHLNITNAHGMIITKKCVQSLQLILCPIKEMKSIANACQNGLKTIGRSKNRMLANAYFAVKNLAQKCPNLQSFAPENAIMHFILNLTLKAKSAHALCAKKNSQQANINPQLLAEGLVEENILI